MLKGPSEDGQTWGGQRKGRGELSQPDTWKRLLRKGKVFSRDRNQAAEDAADFNPSCSRCGD